MVYNLYMAYFPMFVNLENKDVLVIGAGEVAERKIEKLLPFNPKIIVVAKEVKSKLIKSLEENNKITVIKRSFLFTDLDSKFMVIVAVDDINLQEEIFNYCYRRKIPVNSVDSPKFCTFLFPAYVKKEDLVIGISTSGFAPALSGKIKLIIENCLPQNITYILKKLKQMRQSLPKGKQRQEKIKKFIDENL